MEFIRRWAAGLAISGMLAACSGPQEDPRVSFCRGLAADLTGVDVAQWRHAGSRIVEPEYAEVKVSAAGQALSCFYEYEAVEPGAMEHATPLLAYATLPYRVRMGDRVLEGRELTAAVKGQQVSWGKAVLDHAQRDLDRAAEVARQRLDEAGR